jgi:hypothetical protein
MLSILVSVALADPVPITTVAHPPIDEQSGIVRSLRYDGVYWVLNDSGGAPALFAIRLDGTVVAPPGEWTLGKAAGRRDPPVWPGLGLDGATNVDWEDLATDGDRLFVPDLGNNGNARRDLGIYVLSEPNPAATTRARVTTFWPVAYPDQAAFPPADGDWRYDCEAVFWFDGHLYLLTKHRRDGKPSDSTDLYRLDEPRSDRVNVLTHVDHAEGLGGWVTAADLAPDGRRLAILANAVESTAVAFPTPAVGDAFFSHAEPIRIPIGDAKQAEGLAWVTDEQLAVTNEQRQIRLIDAPRETATPP